MTNPVSENVTIQVSENVASNKSKKNGSNNFFIEHVSPEKIKVTQTAFYDLGFDPDFSVDGNAFYKKPSLYKEQPDFNFFHFLIKMVYNILERFRITGLQYEIF